MSFLLATKCAPDKKILKNVKDAGIDAVELYTSKEILKDPKKVIEICKEFPLEYAIHAPNDDYCPEKLAELFSANTGLYNSLLSSLRALQKRGVLDKGLEATLKEDLKIIFKAGQVSTSSSYFAFNTYDSWAERQSGLSEGMTLYQHVNGRLIEKLGLSSNGVPLLLRFACPYKFQCKHSFFCF